MAKIILASWFYASYLDDTFLLLSEDQNPKDIPYDLNSMHTNLSFTMEEEENGSMNFLDVAITRDANTFVSRLHRKSGIPTQFMLLTSFSPIETKRGLVRSEFLKIKMIVSPNL